MSRDWVERYLTLLGVDRAEPTLQTLQQITRAHLERVPFENVTSILRRAAAGDAPVPPLDPNAILASWERRQGGGVCFEVAEMVSGLLVGLGYRAHVVLASRDFIGTHQGVVVDLGERSYLVDVGNGAPFFEPIPLDAAFETRRSGLAYRFSVEGDVCTQERWVHGEWQPFFRYDLGVPDERVREAAYQRHHTPGQSWVVDRLRLITCSSEQVVVLERGELVRYTEGSKQARPISDPAVVAAEVFNLPGLPVAAALRALADR